MSIKTKIYRDFFSKEELSRIKDIINNSKSGLVEDDFYRPVVVEKMSRQQIEILYPQDIKEKLEGFASELCGEPVILSHNSYLDYDGCYANDNPALPPHRDFDNYYSKVTFDYQISKTIDWGIVIEGDKYYLEVGDMLVFEGAKLIHWRENINLKDGDKVELLTMHFSTKEDFEQLNEMARTEPARKERRLKELADERLQEYRKVWKEEREKLANG